MIPFGVIWSGYLLIWYGWSLIKDWNIGIVDLIKPSSVGTVDQAIASATSSLDNGGPLSSASGPGLGTAGSSTFGPGHPAPSIPGESQGNANNLGNAIAGNTQAVRG